MDSTSESGSLRKEISKEPVESLGEVQNDTTQELSNEMLQEIFSHLDTGGKKVALQVDSRWNANVITQMRNEIAFQVNNLIKFGIEGLKNEALSLKKDPLSPENEKTLKEIEIAVNSLNSFMKNNPVLESISLLQVKNNLNSVKDSAASNFIYLSTEQQEKLAEYLEKDKPTGFEDFIYLIEFHKGLHEANKKTDVKEKSQALLLLTKSLTAKGYFERAISLLPKMPDTLARSEALEGILETLIIKGKTEEAISFVNKMPSESDESKISKEAANTFLAKNLIKYGYIGESVAAAKSLLNPKNRDSMLQTIIALLLASNNASAAFDIAAAIPKGDKTRDKCFISIASHFKEQGEIPRALEAAENIINEDKKIKVVQFINTP